MTTDSPGGGMTSVEELGPQLRRRAGPAALPRDVDFRTFVAARWRALHRYAYLLTGDPHAAEDVVQAALEKCWRRWDRITDSPEAYVRAAVANQAASRSRRLRPESLLDDARPAAGSANPSSSDAADHAEDQAVRSGLWQALAELPPRQRAIVVLRVWEDRSQADTARVLGITTGAVKSQLSKAMAKLRAHPQVRDLAGRLPSEEI